MNDSLPSRRTTLLGLLSTTVAPALAWAGPADAREVVAGASLALSGPSQVLGQEISRGIQACFAAVNARGGVAGRQLRFVALDDGYEKTLAGENMTRLIEQEGVIAAIGNLGTATAAVALPVAVANRTLLLGTLSGAGLLRTEPPERYVINYRASYADETAEMVRGLFRLGVRPFEIAFFSQDDAYG